MPDAPCRPRGLVWLGIQAAALAACTLLPGLAASADMAHQTLPGVSPVAKASNGPNDPAELARTLDRARDATLTLAIRFLAEAPKLPFGNHLYRFGATE